MEPPPLAQYVSDWWTDMLKSMHDQQPTTLLGWMVAFTLGAGALSAASALICASLFLMSIICLFGLVTLIGAGPFLPLSTFLSFSGLFFGTWLCIISVLSFCIAVTTGSITLTAFVSQQSISTVWRFAPKVMLRLFQVLLGSENTAALLKILQPTVAATQTATAAAAAKIATESGATQSPATQQTAGQQQQAQELQEQVYAPLSVANLRRHTRSTMSEHSQSGGGVYSYELKDPSSAAEAVSAFVAAAAAAATVTATITTTSSSKSKGQGKASPPQTIPANRIHTEVESSKSASTSPVHRQSGALERLGGNMEVFRANQGLDLSTQAAFQSDRHAELLQHVHHGGADNDIIQMMSLAVMQGESSGLLSISPAMSTTSRKES